MKTIRWNLEKNAWLRQNRGIGFEDVVEALENDRLLDDLPNPSKNFSHQRVLVVEIDGYAIMVPYLDDGETLFLKTLYPDR